MTFHFKLLLITFVAFYYRITAKKYVVDEEHNEQRLRSNDQIQKERIFIGYLAGTSLIHQTNVDFVRTATPPSKLPDSNNSGDNSRLFHKLSYNRRRKRRRTVRIFRNPLSPNANRKTENNCNDDETFITLPLEDQAKCMKIRPSSLNLQGQLISGALRYAVEKINADENLLPNHTLEYKFIDTRGISHLSVKAFMELWGKGANAFIGPEDSCQTEAMMAAAQNLPMVSFKCFDHTVSDKRKYPTFARTAPAESEISKAVIALLKHYNWMQFSIVHGNSDVNKNLLEAIKSDAKMERMKILNVTDFPIPFIVNDDENNDGNNGADIMRRIVAETHKKTRIYLFFGNLNAMRHMLYEMDNQNLIKDGKSEYMVIYVDPAFAFFSPDDASLNQIYRTLDVTIEDFRLPEFYRIVGLSQSLMLVIPTPVQFNRPDYNDFINDIAQYITAPPFEFFKSGIAALAKQGYQLRFNRYASYLYDAVYLYARGLHEVLLEGGSASNGNAIISKLLNRQYQSMQGFRMKIDENGDAHGNYTLLTRQKFKVKSQFNLTHGMIPTAHFVQTSDSMPALQLTDKLSIDWATPDGKVPKDMPDCGFDNEFCIKEKNYVTEITCGILAGIVLICAIIGFSMYRNRKYEQELAGLIWKIDAKEIRFHPCTGMSGFGGSRMTIASHDSADGENIWPHNPTGLAMYKGSLVAIKTITYSRKVREITRATKIEMKNMRNLHHDNINSFMGIIVESNCIRVVREYCAKGSLFDVLLNENLKLDQLFVASFVDDLLKGMTYLHDSELRVHGNLKSTNCVVSSRWSLQVSDFGLHELRDGQEYESEDSQYYNLLWASPELLRDDALIHPPKGTQKGDIYAFAIILDEILSRKGPYEIYREDNEMSAKDIVLSVASESTLLRPSLAELDLQSYLIETLESCWDEMPQRRPDFRFIRQRLKPLFKGILKRNIMDHMITMMEKYQSHLEELVDERTEELKEEKKRTEVLLHRMLPKSVASQLMKGDDVLPETYDSVTIYFSDIVGFTSLSADSSPMDVVQFLNALYTLFDSIIRRCDVYKVETIGDAYMVVSGLPIRNGDKHSGEIATMALQLLEKVKEFQIPHRKDQPCLLRIGIHTGSCVAGVVGRTMPRYCLFGDTVNTASRMESNGLPLKIHISDATHAALEKLGGYTIEERGLVPMKGKGEMRTYWLTGKEEMTPLSAIDLPSPVEDSLFPAQPAKPALRHRIKGSLVTEQSLSSNPTMQSDESLTAVVCRSPKRIEQTVQNNTGSKLLQSVPHLLHQRSIAAPGYNSTGQNHRRFSRLLSPPSAAAAADIMRSRELVKNSGKRASEIPLGSYFESKSETENRLRKRSMSFPENVAALAELVALSLNSKSDSNPTVKHSDSKSFSANSLQKNNNRISIEIAPSKLLDLTNYRPTTEPQKSEVPLLIDVRDDEPPPKYSSLLLEPQIATTTPVRKRSMSCSDAHNHKPSITTVKQPSPLAESVNRSSEGNASVFLNSNSNGVQYFSPKAPNQSEEKPVCVTIEGERESSNQEEEDFLAESPLLFDSNRFKRQRKSAGSLVVSTPKPTHWYPNGEAGSNGGSLPKLNRLLRYFKRPASEDLHDFEPEPSLV